MEKTLTMSERLERARRLAEQGKMEEALEWIRGIDPAKLKNNNELLAAADIYEAGGYLEEAYAITKRAYNKTQSRRNV